jgi:hypothetical protein
MLLKTVFSRKPRYTRPQWQTKNSVAAAAAALSHGSEEKVHEDKAWMSWLQKPATNRNAQYFSMNQPPSRWGVPQLHGPNTSLYKPSANSRDTESFTAAPSLSLSQNTYHLLYTRNMALLLLLLLHIPETQKKENLRAQQQHAEPRGLMGYVPELLKNKKETPHYKKNDGEWMEKERKLVKMSRRRGWQWSSQCRRRHLVQGGNSRVQNRTVGKRVEGGVMLLRCQIQKR